MKFSSDDPYYYYYYLLIWDLNILVSRADILTQTPVLTPCGNLSQHFKIQLTNTNIEQYREILGLDLGSEFRYFDRLFVAFCSPYIRIHYHRH